MNIDLHNHTLISSSCSILDPQDLIRRAVALGLDGIAVTEHNTMRGGLKVQEMARGFGLKVFPAQEISTASGDVLVFGVEEEGLRGISVLELFDLAQERKGILIAAHPFRHTAFSLSNDVLKYSHCFSAIEVFNGNCTLEEMKQARDLALSLDLPQVGGSDAHSLAMVGRYYTNFPRKVSNISELIACIRENSVFPVENTKWTSPLGMG